MNDTAFAQSPASLQNSLGFLVNALARLMRTELERRLVPVGLTPTTWLVLHALAQDDLVSQTELARRTIMDGATMTRALDVLEARGLIARVRDESDRRVQIIKLKAEGRGLLEEIAWIGPAVNDEMTASLTNEEREQLEEIMRRMVFFNEPAERGGGGDE